MSIDVKDNMKGYCTHTIWSVAKKEEDLPQTW